MDPENAPPEAPQVAPEGGNGEAPAEAGNVAPTQRPPRLLQSR